MQVNRRPPEMKRTGRAGSNRIALLVASAALLAACSARGGPGPGDDLAVRRAGACAPEVPAGTLPAAAALVDVERLDALLAPLRPERPDSPAFVVLSLTYEEDGTNIRRDVVQHSVQPVQADSVQELVFTALRTVEEREGEWGARLRIDLSRAGGYAVEPRVYCPPRPRNRQMQEEMREYLSSGVRYRRGQRERTLLVEVDVQPGGYPADARIVRGGAQGSSLERSVRDFVRAFTFDPASLDGVPVPGRLIIAVRVGG
jgi:hypothetical protein